MRRSDRNFTKIPDGKLGIIALEGCKELGKTIDNYIIQWRSETYKDFKDSVACDGYLRDTYLLDASCPRFGSGEAKGIIRESVRDMDLYIIVDVLNYSVTYSLSGRVNHMSPDDHYADLKRIISASAGKAKSVNVIMPFLYESRQHKRSTRESLDCAVMLQELISLGVDNILTFDAHDPRVQNAIPISGFDNIQPTYQFVKSLVEQCDDVHFDNDHLMVISPDEGAMQRAIYMANVVGVDVGMFYKRRDYSTVIDGRNPIVAQEFVFDSDLLIIDDLGTELTNSFVSSQLFLCINERIMRRKSTIISTNLKLENFSDTYSERTFSRIASNYRMVKLEGKDIRIQKIFLGGK